MVEEMRVRYGTPRRDGGRSVAETHITVLGAGPAGLAAGYFLRKSNFGLTILEAGENIGGNAVTFRSGPFRYDSGAHRLHDKDPEVTAELQGLLNGELLSIQVPSQIYFRGRYLDFPLTPLNLVRKLGPASLVRGGASYAAARVRPKPAEDDFESFAVRQYGRSIAEKFLLGYSEKLWGAPPRQLSPDVSGKRLRGLTLGTVARELMLGEKAKTAHLDGTFLYPRRGFGRISEKLAEACGAANIHCNAPVTRILHDGRRLLAVVARGRGNIPVQSVVSSIPLDRLVAMLEPAADPAVLAHAGAVQFRDVILVALFLDRLGITGNGSIYFPEAHFPMTRVYEPRNRSPFMAPSGKTSLVAEIPCDAGERPGGMDDDALLRLVRTRLAEVGSITEREVLGAEVRRLPHAYPVLALSAKREAADVLQYLSRFENLYLLGRSATFTYVHFHELMRAGRELAAALARGAGGTMPRNPL